MIHWIKYDLANPPKDYTYIVTNGRHWEKAAWLKGQWWILNNASTVNVKDITHYAHINLPGEETDNA
ncbi:hypothetical protein AMQ84_27150 [Paenibacillus riograndensis]|uniref:Uncharacterized protein n=1 Tax=Paenibacillus riograndensis TaxID=483937 RepID=A0A132TJX1_9BACL|nr:hypothetical protein [Paenibacillus riograndensis]KWX71602.1 hypothetical protein AMQ84_27150 [Paenibacillus riograndensis]